MAIVEKKTSFATAASEKPREIRTERQEYILIKEGADVQIIPQKNRCEKKINNL